MVLKVPFVYFMDVITGETSLCRPCLLQNFLVCNDIFHSQRMPSREGALVLFVSFGFTAQILYILIKCKLNKRIRYLFCRGTNDDSYTDTQKKGRYWVKQRGKGTKLCLWFPRSTLDIKAFLLALFQDFVVSEN